jgi:hypothetical protein
VSNKEVFVPVTTAGFNHVGIACKDRLSLSWLKGTLMKKIQHRWNK